MKINEVKTMIPNFEIFFASIVFRFVKINTNDIETIIEIKYEVRISVSMDN